ncbi:ATP-binding protein [Algoriphagus marinus]|uniref:ATP-binding protein n=1 Tax=Algoriphagus marinus TaxID=1925762 RepID=UPI00094B7DB0|nr:ATP-binding protein [Algoriphagus marinus]
MIAFLIGLLTFFQPQVNLPRQDSSLVVLHDSLSVQGGEVLSLTELGGWEFTTDNIEDPANSAQWVKLQEPISEDNALLDSLWNGFGYFRLRFKVDSTFDVEKSFLRFSSFRNISAEVFFNNESVLKIGDPSINKDKEEIVARYYDLEQPVNLERGTEYVLIVKKSYHRYSLFSALIFLSSIKPYSFSLSLVSLDSIQNRMEQQKVAIVIAGLSVTVIFILSVLYLILYFKVKDQKENLWLVLLMVSIGGIALNWFLSQFTVHSFWFSLVLDFFILNLLSALSFLLVPLVTHKLLKVQAHIFWKVYVIVGIVIYFLRIDFLGEITFPLILFISLTGGLIAIYKASKQGVRDTFIPALSILGVPLVVIVALAMDYFGFKGVYFIPVLTLLTYNTLPVGLSIYQGKKFLRLNTEMEDLVTERTTQLEIAYKQLEESLRDLKATQSQLIQQEKLASLGELTAGIAHEIQNPLNFVNNFSEVSGELVDEMNEELEKGDIEEAKFIGKDLKDNLSKITLHGKRADAIVKGMLEHSKKGSGQKELTNLNALADEFLRLSYQAFLAKEPDFKCQLKTDLATDLPQVSVIPQDIGKVLLNLINNAFYACAERLAQSEVEGSRSTVNEKAKSTSEDYHPEVIVSSKKTEKGIELSVQDNGSGIPDSIKEKIFQPFFTTKPTGSGTGLGLSLSYDIVKAHGGEIRVESEEGEGSKFIFSLPNQTTV